MPCVLFTKLAKWAGACGSWRSWTLANHEIDVCRQMIGFLLYLPLQHAMSLDLQVDLHALTSQTQLHASAWNFCSLLRLAAFLITKGKVGCQLTFAKIPWPVKSCLQALGGPQEMVLTNRMFSVE